MNRLALCLSTSLLVITPLNNLDALAAESPLCTILEAGLQAMPQDADIKNMGNAIKVAAEKVGDSGALSAIKGLGYVD